MRRFATGLDVPSIDPNEFQRADAAPRATFGDGLISSGDVTQVRRYATGLDPQTPAGGPLQPPSASFIEQYIDAISAGLPAREIGLGDARTTVGTVTIPVEITSHGDETAVMFTLEYDRAVLGSPRVALGDAFGSEVALTVNDTESGRLRVLVDAAYPMLASGGARSIVFVTFDLYGEFGASAVWFSPRALDSNVSDRLGNSLFAPR